MTSAMISEIERDLISQRTSEALHGLKKADMLFKRPKRIRESKLDKIADFVVVALNAIAMVFR